MTAKELNNVLQVLSGVMKPGQLIPALDGVKIDPTSITGGNMQISIKLPFESGITPGILDFQTLKQASHALNGFIDVVARPGSIRFTTGPDKVDIPVIDGPYPEITPAQTLPDFTLTKADIKEVSRLGTFIDPKGMYQAIYFNGEFFAATSGASAGFYAKDLGFPVNFPAYPELFKALEGIEAEAFDFKGGRVLAKNGDTVKAEIRYTLLNETIPNFKAITPTGNPYQITVQSYDLTKLIGLLMVGANPNLNRAAFTFDVLGGIRGVANFEEYNKEASGEIDSVNVIDAPVTIGLNLKFLETVIKYLQSDEIIITLSDEKRALMFYSENQAKTCLLMPVVLS